MTDIDFSNAAVLVVEDEEFIRTMLHKYLSEYGFKGIFEAANGEEAIPLLKEKPSVIICDINMAPVNGIEFAKHVRNLEPPLSRVPIIFLTGDAHLDTVQQAVDLSIDAYLLKPVTAAGLKSRIESVMMRRKIVD